MQTATQTSSQPSKAAQWIAVLVVLIVALLGAFAWLTDGDALFVTLVQQGLAWCF